MSAILGIFNWDHRPETEGIVQRMMLRMRSRGCAQTQVWREAGATLAVARHDWEFGARFAGPVLVVRDEHCAVVADASLYYRDDLRRRLAGAGVRPTGQTPSHLVLAAYQAWGARGVEQLEGDFAFILWDRRQRQLLAARDFVGGRPLFHAELPGGGLMLASSIGALLEHPECRDDVDLAEVAADAAGLSFSLTDATAHRAVRRLAPASRLVRGPNGRVQVDAFWEPVRRPRVSSVGFEDAAMELRDLLGAAVAERMDVGAPSGLWLSGGWDSTAVLGAATHALGRGAGDRPIAPASIALPDDDPWCETKLIAATAAFCGTPTTWLPSDGVPLLGDPVADARGREEPWAHPYEQLKRALVRTSRAQGARVALNGHGGDVLFHVSAVVLADLLRTLRLPTLRREWAALQGSGARQFVHWAVAPLLPAVAHRAVAALRGGRPLAGYWEQSIPEWFDRDFVEAAALPARAHRGSPRTTAGSRAAYEMYWQLTLPQSARVVASVCQFGLEDGVEVRFPMLDRRLIDFAIARPWHERSSHGERKLLLRRAMRGLLPDEVLAPRPFKTGRLGGYFARGFRAAHPVLRARADRSALVERGVVDGARWRATVERFVADERMAGIGVALHRTVSADLWLDARTGGGADAPFASPLELAAV